jgi:dienelactone hydrolase
MRLRPVSHRSRSVRATALFVSALSLANAALPALGGAAHAGTNGAPRSEAPHTSIRVTTTSAPAGFAKPKGQWLRITREDGKVQLAEVFRPTTSGPHPLVVVVHGSSGLAGLQLTWAADLAKKGYVVVAGCYLNAVKGAPPHTFVPCPSIPDITTATPTAIRRGYSTLLDAAATLKGTKVGATAAIGMSYGANVVLDYNDARVKAIVADSGYRDVSGTTNSPVLLLGFIDDPNVPHAKLVAFERAQHKAGKPIASRYYRGTGHVALLSTNTSHDANARTTTFLRQRVG